MNQRFRNFQTVQILARRRRKNQGIEIELLEIYYPPVEQPECGFVMWNVN